MPSPRDYRTYHTAPNGVQFSITDDKGYGVWQCFACGKTGTTNHENDPMLLDKTAKLQADQHARECQNAPKEP
jgi:hypothetical protein